jgi:nicotinamidase/pyrazinamidase
MYTCNELLWVVDCQVDFIEPKGKLAIQDAPSIKDNLKRITELARTKGMKTVTTADWHNEKSEELSENPDFVNTFPVHCMMGTEGANFIKEVQPDTPNHIIDWRNIHLEADKHFVVNNRNIVIYKDKFDVFAGNKNTDLVVKHLNPKKVIVVGVATNVCIDRAVLGLADRVEEVWVVIDAIKELPNIPVADLVKKWINKKVKFCCMDSSKMTTLAMNPVYKILQNNQVSVEDIEDVM